MCSFFMLTHGQNSISYTYDNAGNQIKRNVIMLDKRVAVKTEEVKPIEQGDLGEKILIYPNPTKGEITIDTSGFDEFKEGNVSIIDMQGKTILKEKMISNDTYLNISSNPSGTYIMTINIDGKRHQWKIIKID